LQRLTTVYHEDKPTVEQNRIALLEHLSGSSRMTANDGYLPPDCLMQTAEQLVDHVDTDKGGLAGAPKFPNVPVGATDDYAPGQ
jgi:uncharacterized protein YyaL (SSP411 family)